MLLYIYIYIYIYISSFIDEECVDEKCAVIDTHICVKGELKAKINYFFLEANIGQLSPSKKYFLLRLWPKALRLRITLSAVIFVTYDVWYGKERETRVKCYSKSK